MANLSWRIEVPADNQWYNTGIPVIAGQKLVMYPTTADSDLRWSIAFGDRRYELAIQDSHDLVIDKELTEDLPCVSGPDWLAGLQLRVVKSAGPRLHLDVESQFPELTVDNHFRTTAEAWDQHLQIHQLARMRQEELLKRP